MKTPGPMVNPPRPVAKTVIRTEQPEPAASDAAVAGMQSVYGNQALLRLLDRQPPIIQRKRCACGGEAGQDGECAACKAKRQALQRRADPSGEEPDRIPSLVTQVIQSPGQPLDPAVRARMEPLFGRDLGDVRVHTGARAAESARSVRAAAYTVGRNIVFGQGQTATSDASHQHLLAHELAHVLQQADTPGGIPVSPNGIAPASGFHERQADAVADAVTTQRPAPAVTPASSAIQRRPAPYIKKVTVHLTPPQSAELKWQGTPPADATGSDTFTVSTGKGYGDPGDPPGTCTRDCCKDADKQCAPPWNNPDRVGACCTPYGDSFWTGKPREEHNGWAWWTPIQPFYSKRGIALHSHHEVTGQPIGHGCVRMDEENAKRIYDYSNGGKTNVTIDGRAAPVACKKDRQCGAKPPASGGGASLDTEDDERTAAGTAQPRAGLEGVQS